MSKTTKNEKQAQVPRVRFPDFHEEWAFSPMSDLYSFKGTNSLSRDKMNYDGGSIRNIHYGDIHTKFSSHFRVDAESVPYINGEESHSAIRPENYCAARDMVFADASEDMDDIGKAIEIIDAGDLPLVSGLHTLLARPKKRRFRLGLGAYLFSCEAVRKQIRREAQGAKVLGISASRLGQIRVPYPTSKKEQQKIADCLSSLDSLIAGQAEEVDALKTYKKSLMQQLFPREGETVPRLRFPEFRDVGEWTIKRAKLLFSNRVEPGEDGLPIYSVTMNEGLAKRESLERKIDNITQTSGNKKAQRHDIVYNMMRMWQGASGVAVEDCMVSPAYVVLAPTDNISADFYGYFLKLPQSLKVLTAHSQGLTKDRLRLYFKDFGQIQLPCPPLDEQQKIADCLSSIDALIAAHADRLDALKTHKKGLMQQLFPSPEAVGA